MLVASGIRWHSAHCGSSCGFLESLSFPETTCLTKEKGDRLQVSFSFLAVSWIFNYSRLSVFDSKKRAYGKSGIWNSGFGIRFRLFHTPIWPPGSFPRRDWRVGTPLLEMNRLWRINQIYFLLLSDDNTFPLVLTKSLNAPVAQLDEHRAVTWEVVSSTPAGPLLLGWGL